MLLDVLFCSIAEYFTSCAEFKSFTSCVQTTSENSQRYYTTKRLTRDLLFNAPNLLCFTDSSIRGMRDRSMRCRTELAREIQLTDWSTAMTVQPRKEGTFGTARISKALLSLLNFLDMDQQANCSC